MLYALCDFQERLWFPLTIAKAQEMLVSCAKRCGKGQPNSSPLNKATLSNRLQRWNSCVKLCKMHQPWALTVTTRTFTLLPSTAERVSENKTLLIRSRLGDLSGGATRRATKPEKTD